MISFSSKSWCSNTSTSEIELVVSDFIWFNRLQEAEIFRLSDSFCGSQEDGQESNDVKVMVTINLVKSDNNQPCEQRGLYQEVLRKLNHSSLRWEVMRKTMGELSHSSGRTNLRKDYHLISHSFPAKKNDTVGLSITKNDALLRCIKNKKNIHEQHFAVAMSCHSGQTDQARRPDAVTLWGVG